MPLSLALPWGTAGKSLSLSHQPFPTRQCGTLRCPEATSAPHWTILGPTACPHRAVLQPHYLSWHPLVPISLLTSLPQGLWNKTQCPSEACWVFSSPLLGQSCLLVLLLLHGVPVGSFLQHVVYLRTNVCLNHIFKNVLVQILKLAYLRHSILKFKLPFLVFCWIFEEWQILTSLSWYYSVSCIAPYHNITLVMPLEMFQDDGTICLYLASITRVQEERMS